MWGALFHESSSPRAAREPDTTRGALKAVCPVRKSSVDFTVQVQKSKKLFWCSLALSAAQHVPLLTHMGAASGICTLLHHAAACLREQLDKPSATPAAPDTLQVPSSSDQVTWDLGLAAGKELGNHFVVSMDRHRDCIYSLFIPNGRSPTFFFQSTSHSKKIFLLGNV